MMKFSAGMGAFGGGATRKRRNGALIATEPMIIPHAVFVTIFLNPQMKRWLSFPSVQITLCTVCYGLLGYRLADYAWGRGFFVFLAPAYGVLIARPVINLVSSIRHTMRSGVWLPLHGTHYVFKSTTIHVLEDDDNWRWLPLADVEGVLGRKLNARVLAITYPERLELGGQPARMHMRDDALIAHLSRLSDPMALRFRTWLERNVALPARRTRQRAAGQAVDSF